MKIIELNEDQFRNYSSVHSKRNYCQTVEYANMKKADGYEILYVGLIDDEDNLLAGSVILSKKINNKYRYGYAPNGFLIDFNNKELLNTFSNKLKDFLKGKNYIYVRTNPNIRFKVYDKDFRIIDSNVKTINILKSCGYSYIGVKDDFSKYGVNLNADDSISNIYNNFSRSVKRNISFCLNTGITIHKGTMDNFDLFFDLIKKNTTKSMDYYRKLSSYFSTDYNRFEIFFAKLNPDIYINNFQYLLKMEEENNQNISYRMRNNHNSNDMQLVNKKMVSDRLIEKYKKEIIRATNVYKIFPNGIIVGTCGIIRNNREVYFLIDGYNEQLNYIHSIPLIKWEIIKIYHSVGYKFFSLGPISSKFDNEEYKGLLFSKISFGGEIVEYPGEYDLVINRYLYTIYSSFINMKLKK